MSVATANTLEIGPLSGVFAARYEALIRLAEIIRSHPNEEELFQTLATELREVVEFDACASSTVAPNGSNGILSNPLRVNWRPGV
jgi:hypothetical protein